MKGVPATIHGVCVADREDEEGSVGKGCALQWLGSTRWDSRAGGHLGGDAVGGGKGTGQSQQVTLRQDVAVVPGS